LRRLGEIGLTLGVLLLPIQSSAQEATVKFRVVDGSAGEPIFARVVLKNAAGEIVGSSGYKTLDGHFVPPDGWKVALSRGKYSIHADAGFEFFALDEEWDFDGAAEKRIELKRWVSFRKDGWYAGGDHNHLIRDGAKDKNYGGTSVTLEFAAALQASRGWSHFSAGGGGPWIVDGNPRQLNSGRLTEAAATEWNKRYGDHLYLWWNNEILKTRYGHIWFLGASATAPMYPYTEKPGDAWWAFYDDNWDPWQTVDKSKPIGPFKSSVWDLPPLFDCIKSWRDRGLVSIYAHPTRTFMIGNNRVSNIAVEFPFDLIAGAPVGGLAIMGDAPNHAMDQALWFAALNEGYQVPGIAENDTVFGRENIRVGPHVTYTHVPDMGPSFDLARLVAALGSGRNFVSSGAFCTLEADGGAEIGATVIEAGQPHTLNVHAWASANPSDAIEVLEIIADGKTVESVQSAAGKREFTGDVTVNGAKWVLAKVICKNHSAVAITNPIYFRKPGESNIPEPLRSSVKGHVTLNGRGVPADITVIAWGKEISRAKAESDGSYRLEAVPLAAHLTFSQAGKTTANTILFDDARIAAFHAKVWATDWVGTPGALGGVFPPEPFGMLRELAKEVTIDAELGK
jgi:hypothetical protein